MHVRCEWSTDLWNISVFMFLTKMHDAFREYLSFIVFVALVYAIVHVAIGTCLHQGFK